MRAPLSLSFGAKVPSPTVPSPAILVAFAAFYELSFFSFPFCASHSRARAHFRCSSLILPHSVTVEHAHIHTNRAGVTSRVFCVQLEPRCFYSRRIAERPIVPHSTSQTPQQQRQPLQRKSLSQAEWPCCRRREVGAFRSLSEPLRAPKGAH